ncbi:MAG: hypothetical protein ABJA66_11265 [Actinomycetota bacterium]
MSPEVGKYTPVMRNYQVDKVKSGKSEYTVDIQGLENAPIYDISIKNTTFDNVVKGSIVKNVQGVKLENVKINGKVVDKLV